MNAPRSMFKSAGVAFLFVVFLSFMFFLPSVFAQEGGPSTPTPVEPLTTPEPLEIPEVEQEVGAQILSQPQSSLESGGDWAARTLLAIPSLAISPPHRAHSRMLPMLISFW